MIAPTTTDLATIKDLGVSVVSEEAALRRPLADIVHAALDAAGRSDHTKRSYQTAIGLFLQFLDQERGDLLPDNLADDWRPFAETYRQGKKTMWGYNAPAAVLRLVDAGILDMFRAWREKQGDSANAASQRVYASRTFLAVAYRDRVLTPEQAQALNVNSYKQRQKRDEKPTGRRLSVKEARALRSAPNILTNKGKRDLAILDCMLFLGLRREETAGLDVTNFLQDGGRWWVILTGKGQKTRRLKVHDTLFKSLDQWFQAAGLEWGTEGCMFRSVNKGDNIQENCINASVIGRLVAEYGALAGLAPRHGENCLSPHDLRRTCARNAYDNGASLLLVQNMLGHSDPKTTARYIGAFEDDDNTAIDYVKY